MRLLERDVVFRVEAPGHPPAQQGLNHPGREHADLQAERGRRHVIQL